MLKLKTSFHRIYYPVHVLFHESLFASSDFGESVHTLSLYINLSRNARLNVATFT